MLPKLEDHKIKIVHNNKEYKYTLLNKEMVFMIRTTLELKYKYSTVWVLMYSTYIHGHSYLSLIEKFKLTTGPYLLILKTTSHFYGVYFEESLVLSLHPYGVRRKFIFTIQDKNIKVHDLDIVIDQIVCREDYFSFGFTKTGYKIIIDKTLMKGQMHLNKEEELTIEYLEIYRIID